MKELWEKLYLQFETAELSVHFHILQKSLNMNNSLKYPSVYDAVFLG